MDIAPARQDYSSRAGTPSRTPALVVYLVEPGGVGQLRLRPPDVGSGEAVATCVLKPGRAARVVVVNDIADEHGLIVPVEELRDYSPAVAVGGELLSGKPNL